MKLILTQLLAALFAVAAFAVEKPSIIPVPAEMTVQDGHFELRAGAKIDSHTHHNEAAEFLAKRLRKGTGFSISVVRDTKDANGNIVFESASDSTLGDEGYELTVTPGGVVIRAGTQAGMFYGVQSLLQLLPPQILDTKPATGIAWQVPCVHIKDKPRFPWRGLMLDVSRHFETKEAVEKILDAMALYKLNTFHFHLVDDPGWRIEIKKYPLLTSEGAWRNGIDFGLDPKSSTAYRADGKYGGFYTQKDIKEMVRYAAERHITIVPEIEMPGHSCGALSCYPQYTCTGAKFSRDGDDAIFCPGNEETFTFLENILTEVFKMFPSQFVHIGGDEVSTHYWENCPKCQARMKEEGLHKEIQLEGYLIQRIEKFANAHGKRLIGWSEIRKAGLAKNAAVMDWIGGAIEAASAGHDVVLSPASPVDYAYLDHYQSRDQSAEPRAIGGFLPLSQVYRFDPMPKNLAPEYHSHVLGAQGNLWTEFVPNARHCEYMIFPRELAMAEVTWSPWSTHNWEDFLGRVNYNDARLKALGVNFRPNPTNTGESKR